MVVWNQRKSLKAYWILLLWWATAVCHCEQGLQTLNKALGATVQNGETEMFIQDDSAWTVPESVQTHIWRNERCQSHEFNNRYLVLWFVSRVAVKFNGTLVGCEFCATKCHVKIFHRSHTSDEVAAVLKEMLVKWQILLSRVHVYLQRQCHQHEKSNGHHGRVQFRVCCSYNAVCCKQDTSLTMQCEWCCCMLETNCWAF